ncbi:uncharacterized protein CDV56_107201 [Aspergillus thermomutatus]|uniref:Uncharacterized protein n=1 Tax=Aspergillus thermomutatus TaxID=41047 RepID=A0A397GV17_ASPTH|nr:uncharacterized protein CDV56_107201 [Aspergillus thermomutatus]RHZ54862.1 hypothetical protein CDV56_107201 [Aspergillus thermomutatus]
MADLRFDPNNMNNLREAIHRGYICRISRFLDAHGIPNVLWSELVMNMFLFPVVADGIRVVIPDEHIEKARDLLLAAGFPPCQMGNYCPLYWEASGHAVPYAHFNLVDRGPINYYKPEIFGDNPREWHTLELLKKSEVLWGAPEIPLGPPPPNDPDWWTVNDERLPEVPIEYQLGRIVEADYPVKIPSPARFAESLTLLYMRDNFPEMTCRGQSWDFLQLDMLEVLEKHRLFELKDLPPRTRSWFTILTTDHFDEYEDIAESFAAEMRETGEVPASSPWPSKAFLPPGWHEELKQWEEEKEQMRKKKKEEEEEEEQMRKKEEEVKEEQNA